MCVHLYNTLKVMKANHGTLNRKFTYPMFYDDVAFQMNLVRLNSAPSYNSPHVRPDSSFPILRSNDHRNTNGGNTARNYREIPNLDGLNRKDGKLIYTIRGRRNKQREGPSRKQNKITDIYQNKNTDQLYELKIAGVGIQQSDRTQLVRKSLESAENSDLNSFPNLSNSLSRSDTFEKGVFKETSIVSMTEYVKYENQRYDSNENAIKRILFQRWIKNLEHYIGNFHPIHLDNPSSFDSNSSSMES